MFLEQFPVVVEQRGDGVLGQDVVSDLLLHEAEVLRYVLLVDRIRYIHNEIKRNNTE